MFFKDWAHTDISKHLSFAYNVVWSSTYSYLPALKQLENDLIAFYVGFYTERISQFTGLAKI